MSVSLVVPFRPDGAERQRNWDWLRARYERLFPNWEIVEGTCEGQWSKGIAVNGAVARAQGDVLVVADADVLLAEQALREAVEALRTAPWVIPHTTVYRLSERSTVALLDGTLLADMRHLHRKRLARRQHFGPAGGGVVVTRTEDFVGVDERFTDWGGEDISLARALDTLVGPHKRLEAFLWHLHHEPMPRRMENRASAENEALAGRYLDANGDPVAMWALCEERPYEGKIGGGVVVGRKETIAEVPLDERFRGWGYEDQSWGIALATLAGQPKRGQAELVHLHHPPQERRTRGRGSSQSRNLRNRYALARANPEQMKELVSECRSQPS